MKRIVLVGIVILLAMGRFTFAQSPATQPEESASKPIPSAQEASEALGVLYASMIESVMTRMPGGSELKPDEVLRIMQDVLVKKNASKVSQQEASDILNRFVMAKTAERDEKNKAEGERFLAENATKEGVKTTQSGLQYMIIKEGEGVKPTVEDTVVVHYKGQLIDGTQFDSSYDRGEPTKFNPLQVIPGWTEGLCLMNKGTKARLFIPYELAYGERGIGDAIPPYSVLIFDIEMLDVIKGEPIPMVQPLPPTPTQAGTTPSEEVVKSKNRDEQEN